MTKSLSVLAAAALALLSVASPRADILEQVLVKVNGDIITKTDLEARQIAMIRQKHPTLRSGDQEALQKALAEVTPEVIVGAVDELLMVQRGRELGYAMSTEQFTSIVENIKKENKIENDEQLKQALEQEGMTMADLRRQLERQMLISRVQQTEVMAKLQVTDTELKAYYDANKQTFTTVPQITLREMLFAVPVSPQGVNVAQDDEAKARATEVRAKLVAGEAFPRLAADYSDSPSKANGGLVGPISRDTLSPELQKAIDGLAPGDLTPVLRTERGYQLLKLESASGGSIKPFEEARDEIADRIANEKRAGEYAKYIARLRAEAILDWKNDEVKKAYDAGLKLEAEQAARAQ